MVSVCFANCTVGKSLAAMVMVVRVRSPRSTAWPESAPVGFVNSRINASSSSNNPSATSEIENEAVESIASMVTVRENAGAPAVVAISVISAAFAAPLWAILTVTVAADAPVLLRVMVTLPPSSPR